VTAHLTDAELLDFATGVSQPDDLLRSDDHLSRCEECRMRAARLTGAANYMPEFRAQLNTAPIHLSDEEVQLFVQQRLSMEVKDAVLRHLESCATCASQVENLRSWALPGVRARTNIGLLAIAAAVLMAILIPTAIWQVRSGRQIASTSLTGLDALAPPEQARIQAALKTGAATLPDFMTEVDSPREILMGSPQRRGDTFNLTAPVGTGTVSDRPTFEWEALAGADRYIVTIFDEQLHVAERSTGIAQANWIPPDPLPRSRTFVWQVTAFRGGEAITAPAAPIPPARFHVIGEREAETLQRVAVEHPQSHLLLGILNMEAGIRDAAIRNLDQVKMDDSHFDVAQQSLQRLRALNPRAPKR